MIARTKSFARRLFLVILAAGVVVSVAAIWRSSPSRTASPEICRIILISIDTCRPDRMSCYGYARQTTPNIDAIAEHEIVFEDAISPVPMSVPGHCSMLTGTIPV